MSQLWTILDLATGAVLCTSFPTASFGQHPKNAGWEWSAETQRAVRIDAQPDPHRERWDGEAWVPDLDKLRPRAWARIKMLRDLAEWGGCETPLGRVDTDPDSQRKISGAVQMAMIAQAGGEDFALDWTMKDNSVVAHDGTAMILLGVLVGQHVAACHAVATTKRAEVAAAANAEAIEAIDIAAGWPGDPA